MWGIVEKPVEPAEVISTEVHEHDFKLCAKLDECLGREEMGPVDVYDCACGARRIVPRGVSASEEFNVKPDPRGFPFTVLQDHGRIPVAA